MTVTRGNSLMNCIKWRKERTEKCNFGKAKQINKLPVIVISRLFLIKELLD